MTCRHIGQRPYTGEEDQIIRNKELDDNYDYIGSQDTQIHLA